MSSCNLTSTEVRNIEFLLEKHLNLIDENSKCANDLAEMLFQRKFYHEDMQFDMICTEFYRLQNGYMVYHDIHVLVAKILIKFRIDLQKYESYVENLASVHDSLIPLLYRQINLEDYKSCFEGLPNNVKELLKLELPAEENSGLSDVLEVLDSDDELDYNITIDLDDVFINHSIYGQGAIL